MKRFWTVFGAVALIAVFYALPRADAAPSVYFMAMNDHLLPLDTGTIPIVRNGSVYIPYSVFWAHNVGVSVSSRTSDALVLSGNQKTLTFRLAAGNAYDLETTYSAQTVSRNGTIYVPAYFVCQYFQLEYSYLTAEYGTVIRIKNLGADLNDAAFVRNNTGLMQQYVAAYTNQTPKPTDSTPNVSTAVPTGTTRPTSSVPGGYHTPTSLPPASASASDEPSPSPTEPVAFVSVYLGIQVTDPSNTEAFLDWLDTKTNAVCFFVSPSELVSQGDLVRRILGSGYGIGLYLTGAEDKPETALEQGNRLLRQIAGTTTVLIAAPSLDEGQTARLEQMGYVAFQTSEIIGEEGQTALDCKARLGRIVDRAEETARLFLTDMPQAKTALVSFVTSRQGIAGNFQRMTETSR